MPTTVPLIDAKVCRMPQLDAINMALSCAKAFPIEGLPVTESPNLSRGGPPLVLGRLRSTFFNGPSLFGHVQWFVDFARPWQLGLHIANRKTAPRLEQVFVIEDLRAPGVPYLTTAPRSWGTSGANLHATIGIVVERCCGRKTADRPWICGVCGRSWAVHHPCS